MKIFHSIILFILLSSIFVFPIVTIAQAPPVVGTPGASAPDVVGAPQRTGTSVALNNPLTSDGKALKGGVPELIGRIINAVLGIVGSLALLMFVFGGLLWMTAAGKEDKITQGKNVLIWATLGLVVIFASYAVVRLLLTSLGTQ